MKDPAFLFYTSDFLTGCLDLTMEERGEYITLLCLQHQKGHLSEKTIRLSVGNVSVDVLNKFIKDANGEYFNERLDEEISKRLAFTESRRNNGAKGGRPKKPSGKPSGKPSENLHENENVNVIDYKDVIEKFNKATGKKIRVADDKFKRQLNARINDGFTIDEIILAAGNCSKDKYHIENKQHLTPEFITRADKLQKYLNVDSKTLKLL